MVERSANRPFQHISESLLRHGIDEAMSVISNDERYIEDCVTLALHGQYGLDEIKAKHNDGYLAEAVSAIAGIILMEVELVMRHKKEKA